MTPEQRKAYQREKYRRSQEKRGLSVRVPLTPEEKKAQRQKSNRVWRAKKKAAMVNWSPEKMAEYQREYQPAYQRGIQIQRYLNGSVKPHKKTVDRLIANGVDDETAAKLLALLEPETKVTDLPPKPFRQICTPKHLQALSPDKFLRAIEGMRR